MQNRLIIIGLDGGTFKIIDPLIKEGKLPNLEKLIKGGTRAILKSTIPPVTAPAWVSFMTGMNPGKHGVFDFKKVQDTSYDSLYRPTPERSTLLNSEYYAGNTLWDILGRAGYKVSVVMMPMTYPAWEVNGYMLSGFPCPDFKNPSTYPPEWGLKIGPIYDESKMEPQNEAKLIGLIEECKHLIDKEREIILGQLKNTDTDVLAVVFNSTDFTQHYLWKYLSDESSPYSSAIPEVYMKIDKIIGEMVILAGEESSFLVLSDHGFTIAPKKHFHPNAWLKEEGYLALKNGRVTQEIFGGVLSRVRRNFGLRRLLIQTYHRYLPKSIQTKGLAKYHKLKADRFDWPKTKAFMYRLGLLQGIVINLKEKATSLGGVEAQEYESLRDEIIARLKKVSDPETGERVIKEVYKREQIYTGKFLKLAPDIVFVLEENYKSELSIDTPTISPVAKKVTNLLSGTHDADGTLILKGPKIKQNTNIGKVHLVDLLPTILFDMGLPIPKYLDGKVIRQAFEEPYNVAPIKYIDIEPIEKVIKSELQKEEEEAIKNSLRGLGYLE